MHSQLSPVCNRRPLAIVALLIAGAHVPARSIPAPQEPAFEMRAVDIYSDGTRMSGNVFRPRGRGAARLPAILLCHGWGGLKSHLNATYAPKFAAAGYVVLTFDYRGWGDSDSRLVLVGEQPAADADGVATARVQLVRELVDPFDQLTDIRAALDFLEGEPGVDAGRIGIWGSSLGGGLVIWTASHDPRIRAVVSQVGAMHGRWAVDSIGPAELHAREIERARGERSPVPVGEDAVAGLRGTPHASKFARYSPLDQVDTLTAPTLLIDAENEELFDRTEHGGAVYERLEDRVVSEYHVEPGITHYGIYRERFAAASDRALAWFDRHLGDPAGGAASVATAAVEPAHFHHVHLNVTDPAATTDWYERYFGANRVRFHDVADALFTEKSFLLMNTVETAPPSNLGTTLWHIGWAGVDGPSEFRWRVDAGIDVQTPLTPLGREHYMYFWGPDREVVEVYTGSRNHRFEHVHLLATDVNATTAWFAEHLGVEPRIGRVPRRPGRTWMNTIRIDNVNLIVFGIPPADEPRPDWYPDARGDALPPTEGTAIDHIGFSYTDIEPVYERLARAGVEIVRPIDERTGLGIRSFFVRGPDGLLVEVVEEKPVPEGIWR